ncbi:MAG TPA: FAD-dependent monooxygenase [Rhizomicrobium sp.]|jgi:2-polyprenyl-6-methoxyphenol hydroxylase-like FAD-dependent oxidoreductase
MSQHDVLISGAGPTGLVLALWLTKLGTNVRIIDKSAEPGTTSRALAVHARTLELYRQLDLTEEVIRRGHHVAAVNLWVRGARKARVGFDTVGADITPYPFLHIFPQDEHEKLLSARLEAAGVAVERNTELVSYTEESDRITATLRNGDGREERCEARFIAGCDGARSRVRDMMGTGFPGGTYQQIFYVADVEASGPSMDGELHIDLDEADFLAVFPLAGENRARLIGTVRDQRAEHAETLQFNDISDRAIEHMKVAVHNVNWFSTYRVHHRVTGQFRKGRAFLLGDAAHIHSPAGGQGMNTGIGDAINLAWKLQAAIAGHAPDTLLDTYESERIAFARRLVKTTDRVFTIATADGRIAEIIRTRLVPLLMPAAAHFEAMREWMFRTVSQTTIEYRSSALSEGKSGQVHGGDRLPWVAANGIDNYQSLSAMTWQAHVYGTAQPELVAWCDYRHLPLHIFAWHPHHADAGFAQDALYLLRPDTYVAMADESASVERLQRYFDDRQIRI